MSEIVWYIGDSARKEAKTSAKALSDQLGKRSSLRRLDFNAELDLTGVKIVVVVAGDGGTRFIAENIHKSDNPEPELLLGGGGSEDGWRRSLIHAREKYPNAVVEPQDLIEGVPLNLNKFFPGQVDGKLIFTHTAEFGRATEPFARRNESTRDSLWIPRSARMLLAGIHTGIEQAGSRKKGPIIEAVFTAPDIKDTDCLPQEIFADDLTRVTVPALNVKDMMRLVRIINTGFRDQGEMPQIPEELLQIERGREIIIENHGQKTISLSGDIFPYSREWYKITRHQRPLRVAALFTPPVEITRREFLRGSQPQRV